MKRLLLSIVAALFVASGASAHNPKAWRKIKQNINIIWASDLDRNGCFDQKVIANLMGEVAKVVKPNVILETGDTHHGNGVKSIHDDDWKEHWEDIYNHPKLLNIDWVPMLGNHEYRGNTNAVLEYSKVNPRWTITERYYTRVIKKGGVTIRLVMLDTTPLIDRYRESKSYEDAKEQDKKAQLQWLDKVLSEATEDWVIVAGHHPIHADTSKPKVERENMRETVNKILRQHDNVAMYICGHIHSFQHLRDKDCDIDYIVNSSASLARGVKRTKRTVYCSDEPGFSVITASKKRLSVHMMDKNGNILHTVNKTK
jgi:2',3'-cyclic-nucleotide 2'-phosphodiesterase (5'-nucleotidase family)